MLGLTFRRPFYTGSAVNEEVPAHFQVSIAGHGYVIEPKTYKRMFISQLRPASDQTVEPGEQTINPEAVWRRSRSNWSMGAGQTYLDAAVSQDRRFHASKGIDPWTDHALTLLPATGRQRTLAGAGKLVTGLAANGLYLLDIGANKIKRAPTPTGTYTDCTGLGTNVYDLATDGAYVYAVSGTAGATKIYSAVAGTTVFTALTGTADNYVGCGCANGRLFAWTGDGEMFEISAAGTATAVLVHRLGTKFTWVGVVATSSSTLLLGHTANDTEIYRVAVTDATGALSAPIIAAHVLGEQVTAGAYENGLCVLAFTRSGGTGNVRVASVETNGTLTMGPGVFTADTPAPINALRAEGRFVYFAWSNYDATSTGCGRLDLTIFVPGSSVYSASLIPAYASDQMATGQGTVSSIIVFNDQLLFTVDALGVYVEGNVASGTAITGTLTTGRIRMGLLDFKSFISVDAFWDSLPANATVSITSVVDDGSAISVITEANDGSTGPGEGPQSLGGGIGEWCELTITLTGFSDGTWPVLRWWVLRCIPTTGAARRIQVPVMLFDQVALGAGEQRGYVSVDVAAELQFLEALVSTRQVFIYQEGDRAETVYMANLEFDGQQWSWEQHHIEGIATVELRTLE